MLTKQLRELLPSEQGLVASLNDNSGYHIVLTAIQSEINGAADDLDAAETSDSIINLRAYWKALRKIHSILSTEPARIAEDLANVNIARSPNPMAEYLPSGPYREYPTPQLFKVPDLPPAFSLEKLEELYAKLVPEEGDTE